MSDSRSPQARGFLTPYLRKAGVFVLAGVIMAAVLVTTDAEARRMGGGRSFGRQSTTAAQQHTVTPPSQSMQPSQAAAAPRPAPAPATAGAQPARNRWLGPIAGLAAGLGIAALMSHFGMGGDMANIIMIALIAMAALMVFRFFMNRRKSAAAPDYAGASAGGPFFTGRDPAFVPPSAPGGYGPRVADSGAANSMVSAAPQVALPSGFDSDAFLRNAKVYFVRLQDAWDRGNANDIREFTTPEMFAEVKLDIDARGSQPNRTDVVQLNADMLGVEDTNTESLASVRFHGLIREAEGAAAEPFVEIWNLSRQKYGSEGWLLAGIQQVH